MKRRAYSNEKANAQYLHAVARAKERYDLDLYEQLYRTFVNKVKKGETTLLFRQSARVSVRLLEHLDHTYKVVYDHHRKTIVTFLPLGE